MISRTLGLFAKTRGHGDSAGINLRGSLVRRFGVNREDKPSALTPGPSPTKRGEGSTYRYPTASKQSHCSAKKQTQEASSAARKFVSSFCQRAGRGCRQARRAPKPLNWGGDVANTRDGDAGDRPQLPKFGHPNPGNKLNKEI